MDNEPNSLQLLLSIIEENVDKAQDLLILHPGCLTLGVNARIADDLVLSIPNDAHLSIGDNVHIWRGVSIHLEHGAVVHIGDNVSIGENVFLYVICGLYIGNGVGISNMVDIHDHNHLPREPTPQVRTLTSSSSGFDAAPVYIQSGVILSNKCTVVAGSFIGANSIVGANSVVSRPLPANVMSAGAPARIVKRLAPVPSTDSPRKLTCWFFGDSLVQHAYALNRRSTEQWHLPNVGDRVIIDEHQWGGWARSVALYLQSTLPEANWQNFNYALGGANSRDVLQQVAVAGNSSRTADLAFLSVGTNDVWRFFQSRESEGVELEEFTQNVRACLEDLKRNVRFPYLVLQGEPNLPGLSGLPEAVATYQDRASKVAIDVGVSVVDPRDGLRNYAAVAVNSLWSDGVHLSDAGDQLVFNEVRRVLTAADIPERLLSFQRVPKDEALSRYGELLQGWRQGA